MASAAAVGADGARSPINNGLEEDYGLPGEVTSGIHDTKDEVNQPDADVPANDESDEDLPSNPLRGAKRSRPANEVEEDGDEAGGDDLFGDEEDGDANGEEPARQLDDEELDSGDDMERLDRVADEPEAEPEYIAQEKITMDLEYPRLPGPEPSDGEMYLLKVPTFMGIDPHTWHHTTFQPPTTDHHNFSKTPSDTFSASKTAASTIRWRHSPSNPEQLQSNARILRWSDGSLTLQLASDPSTQYELEGKAVAPPQRNPLKPTPTSVQQGTKGGRQGMGASDERFDSRKDGFTYLLRPYDENGTMLVTHKVTTGLQVRPPANVEDDAIAKLKASLAAANAPKFDNEALSLAAVEENPDQARLNALQAMKDIEKKNKKTLAAQEREAARANRALGGRGLGSNRYSGGGLSAGMLEDDEEGGGRARPSPNKRPKPRRRRNSEYSEDEDYGHKRFSREDEYEKDDFLVDDEEEEEVEDDDDPDDGIVEDERPSRRERERTPKRSREEVDDEADAEGEEDEGDAPQTASRGQTVKKRRVVDDEDEEE